MQAARIATGGVRGTRLLARAGPGNRFPSLSGAARWRVLTACSRVTSGAGQEYPTYYLLSLLADRMPLPHPLHRERSAAPTAPAHADVLALRARDGEPGAFTALVEHMHARALRFAGQMTGAPRDDVEDIVQDAWIRTFRALPRYDAQRSFESWFFTILANCCRSLRVKLRRWQLRAVPLDDQMRDDGIDPLLATSTRSDVARVHRALATLQIGRASCRERV